MSDVRFLTVSAGALIGTASVALAGASVAQIDIIAAEGAMPPGGGGAAITILNPAFTNTHGQAGFVGGLGSERFIWFDDGIIWLSSDALPEHTLTGGEGTMGISDDGGFIYSPSANGGDSVFTHHGLLLRDDDLAPGMGGLFATFNSRPRMIPDGTAFWIAGFTDTQGGSTQGRILYRCEDPSNPASSVPVLTTQETFMVDGTPTTPTSSGIGFAYDVSENGEHVISQMTLDGPPSGSDSFVWLDGNLVLREGGAIGGGATWSNFRTLSINNLGDWAFSGAMSTPGGSSEYLGYNGQMIIRRGDILNGIELESNWAVRWASINNLGQIAHIWEGGFGSSAGGTIFVTNDPSDVAASTIALASINDEIDSTGDGVADVVLVDFNASAGIAPGLDFSDHPWVYAEVDLAPILKGGELGDEFEAVVRFPIPGQKTCPGDLDGNSVVDVFDLLDLLAAWGPNPGHAADLDGNGSVDVFDLLDLLAAWGDC